MARTNKIPQLLVAAGIQYLGTSTRRQYQTLLKIAAIVVPTVRTQLDQSFGGKDPDVGTTAVNLAKITTNLPLNALGKRRFIHNLCQRQA